MKPLLLFILALHLGTAIKLRAGVEKSSPDLAAPPSPDSTTGQAKSSSMLKGTDSIDASAVTRFGLFDGLDKRSSYGQGVFPEPFLVDDSDFEVNEARLDWLHTAGPGNQHTDLVTAELEKGFGQLTLEMEVPIERDSSSGIVSTNIGNIDLGARYPLYEYVSPQESWDTTFGVGAEVGVPVGSIIARNTEVVPKLFNDTRIGDHFTLQSILGYSTLIGASGEDGGVQKFEYGLVFSYTIPHEQLAIPGLLQLVPVFELSGETQTNKDTPGQNSLLGNAGFRANLKPIGPIQPRLGLGYVFPIDHGSSEEIHSGVFTSLVFEF